MKRLPFGSACTEPPIRERWSEGCLYSCTSRAVIVRLLIDISLPRLISVSVSELVLLSKLQLAVAVRTLGEVSDWVWTL